MDKDQNESGKLTYSGKRFDEVDHFTNKDNKNVFCKYWDPEGPPKGLVLIVHGYAEHCGRYDKIASMFNGLGLFVFSQDHVGHGESEGHRVDIADYTIYLRDLLHHVDLMKAKYPGLPLYLFGHSMGGTISILLAHQNPGLFKCAIHSSPMVTKNPVLASGVKRFLLRSMASVLPHLGAVMLDATTISRDENQVKKYKEDPLICHGRVMLRMAGQLYRMTEDVNDILPEISYPFLLLHGTSDSLCDVAGSEEMHRLAKSSDKSLKTYEGAFHELIHEIDDIPDRFLSDIREWLQPRLESSSSE